MTNQFKGLKLIGKGTFTKAYLLNADTVIYDTTDTAKLCIAEDMCCESKLLPEITRNFTTNYDIQIVCPLYTKVRAPKKQLNKEAYTLYMQLRKVSSLIFARSILDYEYPKRFKTLTEKHATAYSEEMQEIFDSFGNYMDHGSIRFEISPRNIATNENGDLILLDCFFDASDLEKVYKQKYNKC